MIRVTAIQSGSIAEELGLGGGTELLSVNGRELEDFLDWEFLTAEEHFLLHVRQPDGEEIEFDIERPLGEPLGVALEPPRIRRCANRCDFCFVDGLPDGLRDVLYIRDDDYRLSFRYGNFATLTNLKPRDVERIIEYRLSPLYVSVHATDPTVRRYLLRNPTAPEILQQLRDFADHGIQFHTQIVMSPGRERRRRAASRRSRELYAFGPPILGVLGRAGRAHRVQQASPGARADRGGVPRGDRGWSSARGRGRAGSAACTGPSAPTSCTCAPGVELPPAEIYDGFEQVENGVGAVRWLQRADRGRTPADCTAGRGRRIGVVTGTAMGPLMPMVLEPLARATGARFELIAVENSLFGPSVTTAGLLPGAALRGALAAGAISTSRCCRAKSLNDDGLFMDNMRLDDPRRRRCRWSSASSKDFIDALHQPVAA